MRFEIYTGFEYILFFRKGKDKCQEYIKLFKKRYFTLGFRDIAIPKGVSDINKFLDGRGNPIKGTPIQCRASINYNIWLF